MPDRAVTCRAMPAVAPDSAYALATDAPAREFPVLTTAADPSSELFKRNDAAHRELVADLRAQMLWAAQGGPEPARQRHLARGKLLPASASISCWTRGPHSSSCRRWLPSACTGTNAPAAASSPASGWYPGGAA